MTRSAIRQLNYYEQPESFEVINGDSQTIPNQSLTINEVLARFQAGTLPDISKKVSFDENADFDNINPLESPDFDLADATAIVDNAKITMSLLEQAKKDAMTNKAEQSEASVTTREE